MPDHLLPVGALNGIERDVVSDRCAAAHATIGTGCRAAKVLVRLV